MTSVLVEGGGTLNYAFLERDLVDKLFLFVAPIICGGREAPTPFSGEGVASLKESWSLKDVELKQFHQDLLIIGYPGR